MFLYFRMQTQLQGLEELARQSRINYTTVVDTVYYDYFANMVCIFIHSRLNLVDVVVRPLLFTKLRDSLNRIEFTI